jgi:hypothetical protein
MQHMSVVRQQERLSYDANVVAVIGLASAAYIWLLPDYAHVRPDAIQRLFSVLQEAPTDAVFLNVSGRADPHEDLILHSASDAFRRFGWHATLAGSFVLPRVAYHDIVSRFAGSDFIHLEACFTSLAERRAPLRIAWLGKDAWLPDPEKKIMWGERVLKIWMASWRTTCLSLPAMYSPQDKLFTIREHHRRSGVFSFGALRLFRSHGGCSLRELWAVRESWRDSGMLYVARAALVGLFPVRWLAWMYEIRNRRT